MDSEALRKIRTGSQIRPSLDLARGEKKPRTTNSLSKTPEELYYLGSLSLSDGQLKQSLAKGKEQFAKQEAAYNRMRQKMLKYRDRLAVTINRNRALQQQQYQLQQQRGQPGNVDPPQSIKTKINPECPFRQVDIRY